MPEQINPQVVHSRTAREIILRLLFAAFKGNPDIGVPHDQVLQSFSRGMVRYTADEVQAQLVNLIDDGLIEIVKNPSVEALPDKLYRITKNGRDFKMARLPWSEIDRFTGKQHL